ncbi:MAG: major facilitator superfamily protein [Bacillales bacterium]|nr:major facilitator superfamily protein [Bacillales bacterium]
MPNKVKWLVIAMVIFLMGLSFLWPLNSIYLHNELGKSMYVTGIVLVFFNLTNLIGNFVGGWMFDKFGSKKAISIGVTISTIGLISMLIDKGWPNFAVNIAVISLGTGLVFPAMYALAAVIWPEGGRKTFNYMYVAANLGVAAGSSVAGIIADISFSYAYAANLALFLLFYLIMITKVNMSSEYKKENKNIDKGFAERPATNLLISFTLLNFGYLLCWFAYVQWQTPIATEVIKNGVSLSEYSLFWTMNGIVIVVGQPILNKVIEKWLHSNKSQIYAGYVVFILSVLYLFTASSFKDFMFAMFLMTVAEMLIWPAIPAIADKLAPAGQTGKYQGIVGGMSSAGRMFGPVVGGVIYDSKGIDAVYTFLVGLLIFGFLSVILSFKLSERHIKQVQIAETTTA